MAIKYHQAHARCGKFKLFTNLSNRLLETIH
jgi:hypothetical protein